MIARRIATEDFCRTLWAERFENLPYPLDFTRNWSARLSQDVLSAFDEAKVLLNRFPEKSSYDLARLISSSVRKSHMAREYSPYTLQVATSGDFTRLWAQHFPSLTLPSTFLRFWSNSHRMINVAVMAFKVVGRIHKDDPKDAASTGRLVSAQMKNFAITTERLKNQRLTTNV